MPTLSQLFDMQRIVDNPELLSLISETRNRYNNNIVELDDRMMELVTAGTNDQRNELNKIVRADHKDIS